MKSVSGGTAGRKRSCFREVLNLRLKVVNSADAAEQKQREDVLRDSEQRSREMIELMPVAVWETDEEGSCVYVNKAWRDLTGLTAQQAMGHGWQQALHEQDRARLVRTWNEVKHTGESLEDDYRFCTPDGKVRWVLGKTVAIRGVDDQVVGYRGVNIDITERKKTETALRQQEIIVASSSDMLALLDAEYTYLDVNPAFLKPLGAAYDDVVGRTVADVLGKKIFSETIKSNADHCMNGTDVHYQEWFDFPVSGRVFMDVHYSPYVGADGRVKGFVVDARDITQRKRSEEALHALTLDLERRVIERTQGLEAANKKLENFSYAVSHDLKAPLRAIDAYSKMLEDELAERLSPEAKRLLDVVRQKAQHMGHLIDDLLAFSGLGRTELNLVGVDMDEMARSVFAELAVQHSGRKIKFTVHDLPMIRADSALMRQVWTNLLDNAIKFTRHRVATRIEIWCRNEPTNYVFCVKDNGAGFESEYRDKLFGVFQRLHDEDEFPGTGVGLANVKQIVERHGGETWADGDVDRGATFFFRLPYAGGLT